MLRRLSVLLPPLALALSATSAKASAVVGSAPSPPRILEERGLVVWSPKTGREHLLLTVKLEDDGPAAVIVETPLAPVSEPVDAETEAAVLRLFSLADGEEPATIEPPPERTPAHARVLQASDAGSLGGFLGTHRLASYEGLASFARVFGRRGFHYVALSLPATNDEPRSLPLTAISFRTPRPFYPLATPEETREDGQASKLEVFTLSTERLALTSQRFDSGLTRSLSWGDLERALGETLVANFGFDDPDTTYWLQRFEPERATLESEDAFFVRIPEPVPWTISEGSAAAPRSKHRPRFIVIGGAAALSALLAWLLSRETQGASRGA